MSEPCVRRRRPSRSPRSALGGWRLLLAAAALGLLAPPAFAAADRFLVEGLADAEAWDTGTKSPLLSRNDGDPATQGRLRLWTAAQFTDRFQGMLLGRIEGGRANGYSQSQETRTQIDEAWVRYAFQGPLRLVAQAGRMTQPAGDFAHRYLSSQNPLIGSPATYDVAYPYALQLTGSAGPADFMAAVTDLPVSRQVYLPPPSSSPRPALAAGVTPFTGLRVGAFATWGPYLAKEVDPYLAAGHGWRDYHQRILGADLQFSRGHFELHGEMTRSLYEVPGQNDERGIVYYVEPKYTWSPRWFTALRLQRSQETQVWLPYRIAWYVTDEDSWDLEAGAGFRIDPRTVLKLSYRVDRSTEDPTRGPVVDHAVALQLSSGFDVRSWFDRPR